MPSKTKGGSGGYNGGGGGKGKQKQRQKEKERQEEKDRQKRVDQKAMAKEERGLCPSERKAKAKMAQTRQERRKMKKASETPGVDVMTDPKTSRVQNLDERKEMGRHKGKAKRVAEKHW